MPDAARGGNHDTGQAAIPPWILLLLRPKLALALQADPVTSSFRVGTDVYRKIGTGDFTAFYDRLHDESSQFVGLEIVPSISEHSLPSAVASLDYVTRLGKQGGFRVFFAKPWGAISTRADQAFGGGMYESQNAAFAVMLPSHFLAPDEFLAIQCADADWIEVHDAAD